jgi:hypothetical protein
VPHAFDLNEGVAERVEGYEVVVADDPEVAKSDCHSKRFIFLKLLLLTKRKPFKAFS